MIKGTGVKPGCSPRPRAAAHSAQIHWGVLCTRPETRAVGLQRAGPAEPPLRSAWHTARDRR